MCTPKGAAGGSTKRSGKSNDRARKEASGMVHGGRGRGNWLGKGEEKRKPGEGP